MSRGRRVERPKKPAPTRATKPSVPAASPAPTPTPAAAPSAPAVELLPGDPAPWFKARWNDRSGASDFSLAAGRPVLLCFLGSAGDAARRATVEALLRACPIAQTGSALFVVTIDPGDEARIRPNPPAFHVFWDFDRAVSRLFGATDTVEGDAVRYTSFTLLLDPGLRVVARVPFSTPEAHAAELAAALQRLPPVDQHAGVPLNAPVLIVPGVFEPAFCAELVTYCGRRQGTDSGTMNDIDGQTALRIDHKFKQRLDFPIEDPAMREALRTRIERRLFPAIQRAFQFKATRLERYLVSCYEGAVGGHFNAHRDDNAIGTAHRRFAVTLNLNYGSYEGGELRFPEFGTRTYVAPTGGAVVFSCSLMHEATPVRTGKRYAFLPFLHDEAAHLEWLENRKFLSPDVRRRLVEID
jgi:predicted 2-oxoglutarate/Fe(II)-dependent dioxygenase YbiX